MAFCDYHACDHCGERKTFYGAMMHDNVRWDEGAAAYFYGAYGDYEPGYRIWTLCHECEKTHEIVIKPREAEITRLSGGVE